MKDKKQKKGTSATTNVKTTDNTDNTNTTNNNNTNSSTNSTGTPSIPDDTSMDLIHEDDISKIPKDEEYKKQQKKAVIMDFILVGLLVIAVIIGIGLGIGLRDIWGPDDKRQLFYLAFPGQLLLNMLKCLILPLMVSSLITATAALDNSASGKLGAAAMFYYMTTTLSAVILGIVLVLSIHPGNPDDLAKIDRKGSSRETTPLDSLLDLIRTCFPDNLVSMCFERQVTKITVLDRESKFFNETSQKNETLKYTIDSPSLTTDSGMNVLGIVVVSISLGCVINHLGPRGKPLHFFFEALNDATMVLIRLVIWYSPIGIIFLIATKFVETDDIAAVAARLGMYMVTVLCGLAIHSIIVLPLLYFIFTRKNPARFALNMVKALAVAWGTASSSATLPVTMDCLVNKNKINEKIVRFVVPIGATINMDGTALYEAVAAIFIAQVNGINLSIANVIVVSLTATAAAVGAAGVPQAGLVTMVIVLTAVSLPTEDVTLILAIDWFLDRFRTAVNVWGDCIGAGILNHLFRNYFKNQQIEDEEPLEVEVDNSDDTASGSGSNSSIRKEKLEASGGNDDSEGFTNPGFNAHHTTKL